MPFNVDTIRGIDKNSEPMLRNWPVVYVLSRPSQVSGKRGQVYIGESLTFAKRMLQHLDTTSKQQLKQVAVVLDPRFNKSVCLDLESQLIQWAHGDETNEVLNANIGVTNADYYDRATYQELFDDVYEALRGTELFHRTIPEIVNSEMFKLSPFKALNEDQTDAVYSIMNELFARLSAGNAKGDLMFVQGGPGTGKTVVAIYLIKLLRDIADHRDTEDIDGDDLYSDFFLPGYREVFEGLKVGIVVPQQSLRVSMRKVFKKTPGLSDEMVLSPWDVAESESMFDVLLVDEAHRLNQHSNQSSGVMNKKYRAINEKLFDGTREHASQLHWVREKSRISILMLDLGQRVRPNDLLRKDFNEHLQESFRWNYVLRTQMRSLGGNDYIEYVRQILSKNPPVEKVGFGENYELALVDSPTELLSIIRDRDQRYGLARLVAGFAWDWTSKKNKSASDIFLGEGVELQWNSQATDWINSPKAPNEVGSIHTVQGYDLNYAGVIIGGDLRYDLENERLYVDRGNYFDKKGKANNSVMGQTTSDEVLLEFITNIYSVLMTRGMRGTFIHIVDPGLREYFGRYFDTY